MFHLHYFFFRYVSGRELAAVLCQVTARDTATVQNCVSILMEEAKLARLSIQSPYEDMPLDRKEGHLSNSILTAILAAFVSSALTARFHCFGYAERFVLTLVLLI